jgi:hypothetical protein
MFGFVGSRPTGGSFGRSRLAKWGSARSASARTSSCRPVKSSNRARCPQHRSSRGRYPVGGYLCELDQCQRVIQIADVGFLARHLRQCSGRTGQDLLHTARHTGSTGLPRRSPTWARECHHSRASGAACPHNAVDPWPPRTKNATDQIVRHRHRTSGSADMLDIGPADSRRDGRRDSWARNWTGLTRGRLPRCNPPEQLKSQLAQRRWYCRSLVGNPSSAIEWSSARVDVRRAGPRGATDGACGDGTARSVIAGLTTWRCRRRPNGPLRRTGPTARSPTSRSQTRSGCKPGHMCVEKSRTCRSGSRGEGRRERIMIDLDRVHPVFGGRLHRVARLRRVLQPWTRT